MIPTGSVMASPMRASPWSIPRTGCCISSFTVTN